MAILPKYKISIVLCTYNGSKYVAAQLESILQQTIAIFEMIIVDDASTDDTVTIIEEKTLALPHVKRYVNKQNLGFNKNFEYAISLATGDFIAIADQDDIWAAQKLERMLQVYNGEADIIHCNSKITTEPEQLAFCKKQSVKRFAGNDLRQLFFFNTVEGHCMLVRNTFVKSVMPFPKNSYYDWWLAMQACMHNGVQWVNSTLVARRLHANNASVKSLEQQGRRMEVLQILTHLLTFLKPSNNHFYLVEELVLSLSGNTEQNQIATEKVITKHYKSIFFFKNNFSRMFKKKKYINKLLLQLFPKN
jgi:glycosyltransferase involved in cell wall biosynthesis